jgi:hypothetical protein
MAFTMRHYGTWNNTIDNYRLTVEQCVGDSLDGWPGIDADKVTAAYRASINNALPDRVSLQGDEFYGPAYPDEDEWQGYPLDDEGELDIAAIVAGIDFWAIVEQFDQEV